MSPKWMFWPKSRGGMTDFTAITAGSSAWRGVTSDDSGDVYAAVYQGDIFCLPDGGDTFTAMGQAVRNWWGMGSYGADVYVATLGAGVYKLVSGTFTAIGAAGGTHWWDVAPDRFNGVYITARNGDIWYSDNGGTSFSALGLAAADRWIARAPNDDIYAVVDWGVGSPPSGGVFIRESGVGPFTSLNQVNRRYNNCTVASNGDVYTAVFGGDIYVRHGGQGDLVPLEQTYRNWRAMGADKYGNIYAVTDIADVDGGKIYRSSPK